MGVQGPTASESHAPALVKCRFSGPTPCGAESDARGWVPGICGSSHSDWIFGELRSQAWGVVEKASATFCLPLPALPPHPLAVHLKLLGWWCRPGSPGVAGFRVERSLPSAYSHSAPSCSPAPLLTPGSSANPLGQAWGWAWRAAVWEQELESLRDGLKETRPFPAPG